MADLYISTSNYEGLSFAILEALSLHKPVLLSDCVGNRNIVRSGLNGDYFKNASEAILKIMHYGNNQDMLPIMGQFSRQICANEFDSSQNFAVYRQRYERNLVPRLQNI
jgi:glycosyltransferase involved in cell wall biosynthesis